MNNDNKLSFAEFRGWYLYGNQAEVEDGAAAAAHEAVVTATTAPPASYSLQEVRSLTGLHQLSVEAVVARFQQYAGKPLLAAAASMVVRD